MNKHGSSFDEYLFNKLKKDPEFLQEFLNAAVGEYDKDQDLREFLDSLHLIAKAKPGGISGLARGTGLNRNQLQRMFKNGNPTLKTLQLIFDYLGFKLSVAPKQAA